VAFQRPVTLGRHHAAMRIRRLAFRAFEFAASLSVAILLFIATFA
jgi:hypothetical protein